MNATLNVVDVSVASAPELVETLTIPDSYGADTLLAIAGSRLYWASSNLTVVDIAVPTGPSVIGSCNTNYDASDIEIAGDYAYITAASAGLLVVSLQ